MKQKYSFEECYQILGGSPDQPWREIRKTYKRLIQKSHPDKLENESEKKSATAKIKVLSSAYAQLESYYKQHKSLPPIESTPASSQQTEPQTNSTEHEAPTRPQPFNADSYSDFVADATVNQEKSTSSKIFSKLFVISLCIAGLTYYYFFELAPPPSQKHFSETKHSKKTAPVTDKQKQQEKKPTSKLSDTEKPKDDKKKTRKIPEFFTIGSPIGEVIDVQGKPDKIEKDIWFYGLSQVHFTDGFVTDWKRSKGYPLKARLQMEDFENSFMSRSQNKYPSDNKP